ncbi:hypothetical protein C8R46DRAFT_1191999 [Mycena filopes]|nr:hypothetical protein C8R46DRAFT_1191999 [Mycena filopes]
MPAIKMGTEPSPSLWTHPSPTVMSAASSEYELQLVAYVDVACLTLLTYDTLLNASQEYQHIWKSKWGLIKCLYLWSRYGTFVDTTISVLKRRDFDLNPASCAQIASFYNLFSGFGILITEVILMVRTYALYGRPKKLIVFFSLLWLAICGVGVWVVKSLTDSELPLPSAVISCNSAFSNNALLICYSLLLFSETVVVVLTLWKGVHMLSLSRSGHRSSNPVVSFYRDGIMFYLWMLLILVVVVIFQSDARYLANQLLNSSETPHCVSCTQFSRVIWSDTFALWLTRAKPP